VCLIDLWKNEADQTTPVCKERLSPGAQTPGLN